MLQLVVAVVVAACATLALYAYYSLSYWTRRSIPQIPSARFPLGHIWKTVLLRLSFGEECSSLYEKVPASTPLAGAYFFTNPAVVVRDPDLIKRMLIKDFQHFHDRGFYINEKVDPLSGHLFLMPGERWRLLRNKLSPTFTSGKMKMMFPIIEKCARELAEVLDGGSGEAEFRDLAARFTTDVIASCAFGFEVHSLQHPDEEFRYWGKRLVTPTTVESLQANFCNLFPKLADIFWIHSVPLDVDRYFTNLVKDTMNYRDAQKISRGDFLQLLMNLRDDQGVAEGDQQKSASSKDIKLNTGQLAAQCVVFFLAGFETSSTTMSFALHELALNPDIQKKLQQEVDETIQKSNGQLTYDDVMNMPYLDKVVSETLRKYPPVPTLNREVTQEYKVPDTEWVMEKGTSVIIPVLGLHYDPQYYPQPQHFDPERFSEEQKNDRHDFVYLPFGDGPRVCIGMRFGLMQTKIGLASLLSRYNIETCSRTVKELKMDPRSFILTPVSGIWLRYVARSQKA
ncbi:probable cytochrome P450 6a14 [Schistocerca piceifrons]|uniref:probable cytochrome P450 6a14 n=1 Tax=Schistocerca piceifrons TaxID=274613 RepID=UPI001F5F9A85|nr:probable cytochrome P450 6a14 [Schistocerca piceifrons]